MLTLESFEEAAAKVKEVTQETKLIYSSYFSDMTGNKVYLKPENMQRTGAYKVRGAYYKISTLSDEERNKGLITASAGNHAQGVAYASHKYGVKAVIVMPTTTPLIKCRDTCSKSAPSDRYQNVIYKRKFLYDLHGDSSLTGCYCRIVKWMDKGISFFFCKGKCVCAGFVIYVAVKDNLRTELLVRSTLISGVEPAGAACMKASLEKGEVVTLPQVNTIADGTAVQTPGKNIFPYIQENLDDIITIDDDELIVAFHDMVENHKMIVENSGLLTVAALRHLDVKNKKIVSILSGGNMDVITMSSVVQHGLIQRDRIFTVSVLIPDKPGELVRVACVIAENQGNVIKLDHNQFVSTNRNAAVELRITMEAFGTDHKNQIVAALEKAGCKPRVVRAIL